MRVPLLILAASLVLSGCKNSSMQDNSSNVDENLTAQNIVSNDVTAIDAVTGDAANMAADVDMNDTNFESNGPTPSASEPVKVKTATPRPARSKTQSAAQGPANQVAANSE